MKRRILFSEQQQAEPHAAYAKLVEAERLRRGGHLDKALSMCLALVKEHPDYVGALQTLGSVHLERGSFREAFRCLSEAAMLCPEDAVTLDNLAKACMGIGAHETAARFLREARNLRPGDREILWSTANLRREQRDYAGAADVFRSILNEVPSSAEAVHGLGDCLVQLGLIEDACNAFAQAHRLQPASVAILYSLSQLPCGGRDIDLISALANVRRQKGQSETDFATLCALTQAAALNLRSDPVGAWASLSKACRLAAPPHVAAFRKQRPFMAAALAAARSFVPPRSEAGPSSGPTVLFILGPSRAGKTALERLVAAMPGVRSGHESRLVERATRRTSQLAGFVTTHNPNDLPATLDDRLRAVFAEEAAAITSGAEIVTDTYPAMIPYVGKVATVLPNVRFVFMDRDPHDMALRILLRQYRSGNHHAYDVTTVFEYLQWYRDMTQAWREKLPGLSLDLRYEDMVAEPAVALGKVARLCGMQPPVELPATPGDDRGCAAAYREFIDKARAT